MMAIVYIVLVMTRRLFGSLVWGLLLAGGLLPAGTWLGARGLVAPAGASAARAVDFPDPIKDIPRAAAGSAGHDLVSGSSPSPATAVLAGGCFWGIEAIFERLRGVSTVVSGFAGGSRHTAHYEVVSLGWTGHAESVEITYDPSQITYGQLLKVFFAVAHDPTQLNRQGPDEGTQYRSSIFYASEAQREVATAYIGQLEAAKVFRRPIVTTVVPLQGFYQAEAYHQHFLEHHPTHPYIVYNDLPKLKQLETRFPELLEHKTVAGRR
jgi:peptide-methionine (S)-S-oxide reductase